MAKNTISTQYINSDAPIRNLADIPITDNKYKTSANINSKSDIQLFLTFSIILQPISSPLSSQILVTDIHSVTLLIALIPIFWAIISR